ncbi:MAG: hypothetical protein JSR66_30025 [Proteobacteria bacterium]|nr:hypothetical protein [Pseudomonadota bacterium]
MSVTVYRSPDRSDEQQLELDDLGGFALVTETRTVTLTEGDNRVRFEGVADGIEPESDIITGLPGVVLEKNRDARLLSPAALVAATLGRSVMLVRTQAKTGKTRRSFAKIRSGPDGGLLFETSEGIEALRCSGLPETLSFITNTDLSSSPTLSARVRSSTATTAKVTLSYLARGFDWMASYVATLAPDQKTMTLGAWVTLANSNGISFPSARTQIVAGRVNHSTGEVQPLDLGAPIVAECWPTGNTSTGVGEDAIDRVIVTAQRRAPEAMMVSDAIQEVAVAKLVKEEQLGDLKLYRVPDRTTLQSRQIKQVRLLDRQDVPVDLVYGADLDANVKVDSLAANKTLRTRNDTEHHLGLPLPSGSVASFLTTADTPLLLDETPLRDIAVNEDIELGLGTSTDVQVESVHEKTSAYTRPALLRGVARFKSGLIDGVNRVEIHNARNSEIHFELRLQLDEDEQLIAADAPLTERNGRPLFAFVVPPGRTVTIRYQTETRH